MLRETCLNLRSWVLLGSTVSGWMGWLGFYVFYWGKTVYGWFGWSTFSTGLKPGWNGWKSICLIMLRDCSSHNDYSQELPRFNQKRLEKCSTRMAQPYQSKPVAVETADPNRTRPQCLKHRKFKRGWKVNWFLIDYIFVAHQMHY